MEVCSSSPITSLSHQCHKGTACLPGAPQWGTDVPENCSGREQPPEGTAGTQTSWAGNHPDALLLHPACCKLPYHSFICTTQLKVSTRNKSSQGETAPTSADHQSWTRTTQTRSSVTSQGHEHPHTRGSCPSPGVPAGAGCPGQPTSTAQLAGTHQPCPRARSITSFFLLLILAALQSFSFLHFFFFCAATRSSAKNSSSPSRTPSSSSEDEKDNSRGRPPRAQLSFALPAQTRSRSAPHPRRSADTPRRSSAPGRTHGHRDAAAPPAPRGEPSAASTFTSHSSRHGPLEWPAARRPTGVGRTARLPHRPPLIHTPSFFKPPSASTAPQRSVEGREGIAAAPVRPQPSERRAHARPSLPPLPSSAPPPTRHVLVVVRLLQQLLAGRRAPHAGRARPLRAKMAAGGPAP